MFEKTKINEKEAVVVTFLLFAHFVCRGFNSCDDIILFERDLIKTLRPDETRRDETSVAQS